MILNAPGEKSFSQAEVEMLRKYKRFLQKYGMKEALYCLHCEERGDKSGLKAYVTDGKIDMECRCTVRRHRGQTF